MKAVGLIAGFVCAAAAAHAQTPTPAAATDSAAPPPVLPARASWLSDRRSLRAGDILTVIVDERVSASERDAKRANASRQQGGDLSITTSPTQTFTPKGFGIGYQGKSDNHGEADRRQDLSTVLSVRVLAVEAGGIARIEGRRTVAVDGRNQEIVLQGRVRAEDVSSSNTLLSSRIADAVITYKGKSIGPKSGIFGKILGMLWP
ncbi:MAG: flagellar basal body L-ring protein FlgH [Gemmatimonadales bacterium]|nr:flagellar basal body L-ring protein FlgH [Gemmatimonadales bacterium]